MSLQHIDSIEGGYSLPQCSPLVFDLTKAMELLRLDRRFQFDQKIRSMSSLHERVVNDYEIPYKNAAKRLGLALIGFTLKPMNVDRVDIRCYRDTRDEAFL